MNKAVRLSKKEIESIRACFLKHFGPYDRLWLFGSRADLSKKGGDIDLYIESNEMDPKKANSNKISFVNDLWLNLGEQKIDVVLNLIQMPLQLPIYEIAKKTGIQLQ